MNAFLKIERCGEVTAVKSEKTERGAVSRRTVVLREWFEGNPDRFVAEMSGDAAQTDVKAGDIIYGDLRFRPCERGGQVCQEVTLANFVKLGNEDDDLSNQPSIIN